MDEVTLKIHIDEHNLFKALNKKATELEQQINKLKTDLVDIAHKWVQREAPRKTGRLKSAVKKEVTNKGGTIFISKNIAPYADWVIDGTRAHTIIPKNARALYWKGAKHPVKKVHHPGTKGNPFVDRSINSIQSEITKKISDFEKWLEEI